MVPLITGGFIYLQNNNTNNGRLFWQLKLIISSNIISAFCITWLIFVPWKKGPAWYLKFSDKILLVLLILNYLLLPIINLVVFIYFIINPDINLRETSIQPYIIFFNVICIMRVVEYFYVVKRTIIMDINTYVKLRDDPVEVEELQTELIFDDRVDNVGLGEKAVTRQIIEETDICYYWKERAYG
jgi:predicted Co/Zn/Cd cation transporter (cation efflux family)